MTLSIQQKVVAALAAALLVLGAVASVSYGSMRSLVRTMESVERANGVLHTLEEAYIAVSEAEASTRGYVLTGDRAYLERYHGAEAEVGRALARVDQLTTDTVQVHRLARLRPLVERRFAALERTVGLRADEGFAQAVVTVRSGEGKALMDSVRIVIDSIQADERGRLERRSSRERLGVRRTARLIVLGILLASGISLLVVLVVRHDVRAVTSSQRALRQAKEAAEAASRTKSDFLARMSHELRTPLNSVIGFSNILLRNTPGRLTPQELEYLGRVRTNGVNLLALINDVLDLSKIEAGRMRLEREPVDLAALVTDTLAGFEGQLRERDVELRADVPAGLEPLVTDSAKLVQVLVNLVGNALKFTEEGSVTVRVVADGPGGRVPSRIDVVDTGIGVPPDRRSAIFEAFEQADSGTSRRFGGTGLGLSISRALCDLMGYRLETTDGEDGRGSVFSIVFARSPAAVSAASHEESGWPRRAAALP